MKELAQQLIQISKFNKLVARVTRDSGIVEFEVSTIMHDENVIVLQQEYKGQKKIRKTCIYEGIPYTLSPMFLEDANKKIFTHILEIDQRGN